MAAPYRAAAAPAFPAISLGHRKAPRRQHVRRQHLGVVAQAAATAEAALKETDLHDDLKKALANVKPKVSSLGYCHPACAPVRSHDLCWSPAPRHCGAFGGMRSWPDSCNNH